MLSNFDFVFENHSSIICTTLLCLHIEHDHKDSFKNSSTSIISLTLLLYKTFGWFVSLSVLILYSGIKVDAECVKGILLLAIQPVLVIRGAGLLFIGLSQRIILLCLPKLPPTNQQYRSTNRFWVRFEKGFTLKKFNDSVIWYFINMVYKQLFCVTFTLFLVILKLLLVSVVIFCSNI